MNKNYKTQDLILSLILFSASCLRLISSFSLFSIIISSTFSLSPVNLSLLYRFFVQLGRDKRKKDFLTKYHELDSNVGE